MLAAPEAFAFTGRGKSRVSLRRQRLAAVFSAALQLALSFGLGADLVFCTGAGGHVAVESAYSADCCDPHALPDGLQRTAGNGDCGCIDTPILQSAIEARQRLDGITVMQVLPLPAFRFPTPAAARVSFEVSPSLASATRVRRSVVLLV